MERERVGERDKKRERKGEIVGEGKRGDTECQSKIK